MRYFQNYFIQKRLQREIPKNQPLWKIATSLESIMPYSLITGSFRKISYEILLFLLSIYLLIARGANHPTVAVYFQLKWLSFAYFHWFYKHAFNDKKKLKFVLLYCFHRVISHQRLLKSNIYRIFFIMHDKLSKSYGPQSTPLFYCCNGKAFTTILAFLQLIKLHIWRLVTQMNYRFNIKNGVIENFLIIYPKNDS